ncbi:MAG TPA: protoporphyrinogen oxidase, partial [Kiritimatiellia bacterium]
VIIIGGGITGLAAAYYLQKRSREAGLPVSWTLMESSTRLGGKIITDTRDNFIIEGGPDSFIVDKPWAVDLCHEVGLGEQLIPSNEIEKKVYVLRKGRCVEFPSGFQLSIPTRLGPFLTTPLITPAGKLRMAMDLLIPARKDATDESLADFIRRRFGHEALDRFAGPLLAGIFVSDPEKLSILSTFPRFVAMEKEFGSLIRAARNVRRLPPPEKVNRPAGRAMFNSLKGGMQSLVTAITKRLEGDVRVNCSVTAIDRREGHLRVQVAGAAAAFFNADAVILTTPAYHAARMVEGAVPKLAFRLQSIRYVSTATVSLAFLKEDLPESLMLDGFGVMIPPSERRRLIACTWASTKFKHRAPPDCLLLRAFIGGYRDEELAERPDDELLRMVAEELEEMFGIKAAPVLHRVYRWTKGNPQYDVGHLDRVAEMEKLAAELPGLYLAGSAYRGIGMPDCIHQAGDTVDKVLNALTENPTPRLTVKSSAKTLSGA